MRGATGPSSRRHPPRDRREGAGGPRKALEDFGKAAGTLKGKKKSHKGRNAMLLAGLIAGALYNPWSGPQTREWLMDKVAGDGDLQPLDGFDLPGEDGARRRRFGKRCR